MLECLLALEGPFTAKALYERLLQEAPVDLATVYRFLALLHEKGIVREMRGEEGTQFFEKACIHNPLHPHFRCTRCKRIFCLDRYGPGELGLFARLAGERFEIDGIDVELTGLCPDCKRKGLDDSVAS